MMLSFEENQQRNRPSKPCCLEEDYLCQNSDGLSAVWKKFQKCVSHFSGMHYTGKWRGKIWQFCSVLAELIHDICHFLLFKPDDQMVNGLSNAQQYDEAELSDPHIKDTIDWTCCLNFCAISSLTLCLIWTSRLPEFGLVSWDGMSCEHWTVQFHITPPGTPGSSHK